MEMFFSYMKNILYNLQEEEEQENKYDELDREFKGIEGQQIVNFTDPV